MSWTDRLKVRLGLHKKAAQEFTAAERELAAARRANLHPRKRLVLARDRALAKLALRRAQVAVARRHATPTAPRIVTAKSLGMTFDWVFGQRGTVYRATGHYTAGPRARNAAEGVATARAVHAQHRNQGWGGCSYDAMICDDGTLILLNPPTRKSAHVASNNTGNASVNCPGTTGDQPTAAQQATFRWYLANAHTSNVPREHRQPVDLRSVRWYGHNDLNATACPGAFKTMYVTKGARR